MARPNAREAILEAAEDAVLAMGAANLTLDAVAERAGISKGGLLYHFPTKEALLAGMVGRLIAFFEAEKAREMASMPECPGRELAAHIATCASIMGQDRRFERIGHALIAASAANPRLLQPFRDYLRERTQAMLGNLKDVDTAAILFLATEGLHHLELLGTTPFTGAQVDAFEQELIRRAKALE